MHLEPDVYRSCRICPRECGIDRYAGERGFCGQSAELRVAAVLAHFGEEPPISGTRGSGTVFFSGCSLRCRYCQNIQISQEQLGESISVEKLADRLVALIHDQGIHNINFVTPDHFGAHLPALVNRVHEQSRIPVVYNTSGYCRVELLRELEKTVDIYLPDFKYSDADVAKELSHARDYPHIALDALSEMVRQKGFLDSFSLQTPVAGRGVLVRHLVLPGFVQNSKDALSLLYGEFGRDLPVSLMSQYYPVCETGIPSLQRRLTVDEFNAVVDHVYELGFRNLFVQKLEGEQGREQQPFVPDFRQKRPFRGNKNPDQVK